MSVDVEDELDRPVGIDMEDVVVMGDEVVNEVVNEGVVVMESAALESLRPKTT